MWIDTKIAHLASSSSMLFLIAAVVTFLSSLEMGIILISSYRLEGSYGDR